jgi:hypothetical protein
MTYANEYLVSPQESFINILISVVARVDSRFIAHYRFRPIVIISISSCIPLGTWD